MVRNVFWLCCTLGICLAYNTQAQIDLGVDEAGSSASMQKETSDKQQTSTTSAFSFFDKALNLFNISPSETATASVPLDSLKAKADSGNIEAQLDLGYTYLYGINGTPVDYKQALHYYELAGESKNPVALNNLGSLYFNGIGTDVDYPKALHFFNEAAQLGSDDAAINLAIIYLGSDNKNKTPEEFSKIRKLLEQSQSNSISKYLLGYSYLQGFMVKKNEQKAFTLIKKAADDEYDEAQLVLASLYIQGKGTPKNYTRAVEYLQCAVDQGNFEAMYQLATIYAEGKIYKKNIMKAHTLYNIAAVLGKKEAAQKRDELENFLKIEDLLAAQSEAENYQPVVSKLTAFIKQTYGNSLKAYIDMNLKTNSSTTSKKETMQ
jgi:hypothetical protein